MWNSIFKVFLVGCLCTLTACEQPAAESTGQVLETGMVNPGYHEQPDWFKQTFLDINDDIQEAAQARRRLVLYFYQDGCPYCKKLIDTNFSLRDITETTRRNFDVVAINIWGDRSVTGLDGQEMTEKQFAEALKVMFTPSLLFLDENGKVVVRLNGYYPPHKFRAVLDYVSQHKEQDMAFRQYWARQAPPASTGILHNSDEYLQPPYQLAKRNTGKPLLIMFEQKDCLHCDEMHLDILKREESKKLLSQFDVVLLDAWSDTPVEMPTGERTTASDWAKKLNIHYVPTLVMFDRAGQEVFRAEAYLKAFHIQSALDYVLSGAYRTQPNFQRFVQARADALEAQGIHVDLMQ